MQRRDFLVRAGLALGGAAVAASPRPARAWQDDDDDWSAVREQFDLTPGRIHMALFFLAPHPRPVRSAIERHRRGFDADPHGYFIANVQAARQRRADAAAAYLGVSADEIAFTDSTTMGLGLVYGSLRLRPGQEIVTTEHDHYSTDMSLRYRAERTGATVRKIRLYQTGADTTVDGVVEAVRRGVTPRTRVLAVTWVHSCTGVKLPIRAIADTLAEINDRRADDERILLCVDGVHGLAAAADTLPELGCDVFIAGTHKWLYGPRGTGLVWARPQAWSGIDPIIPPFDWQAFQAWIESTSASGIAPGHLMSPGGFHSFEHRWAVTEAFEFHQGLGRRRVTGRINELNTQLKSGLARMPHVTLHTPMSADLSAGIVCFEVAGLPPETVVERLDERGVLGSTTPYATQYARLAPCIVNTPDEVEDALRAVYALA